MKEQETFLNFPTSFDLSAEQVDRLREVAGRLLFSSPDFHRLVRDLGGTLPESAEAPIAPFRILPASTRDGLSPKARKESR